MCRSWSPTAQVGKTCRAAVRSEKGPSNPLADIHGCSSEPGMSCAKAFQICAICSPKSKATGYLGLLAPATGRWTRLTTGTKKSAAWHAIAKGSRKGVLNVLACCWKRSNIGPRKTFLQRRNLRINEERHVQTSETAKETKPRRLVLCHIFHRCFASGFSAFMVLSHLYGYSRWEHLPSSLNYL